MSTVVLSGGVGGARFLSGIVQVIDPKDVTVISNTGDDCIFFGLYVSPDIDIVIYTLAGIINKETGWGLAGDTFHALEGLKKLGNDTWFNLGDKDLAIHVYRTMLMKEGKTLSQITDKIARAHGLQCRILPMSDDRVETVFKTPSGEIAFQEYMVKLACGVKVEKILFRGADIAHPASGVLEAIEKADHIIIAPSNPFISIGAILSIEEIKTALVSTAAKVAAISPIVGGNAIKGPAAALMRDFGYSVSPVGVAQLYHDFVDLLVVDQQDKDMIPELEAAGVRAVAAETLMNSQQRKEDLARFVLKALRQI